MGNADFDHIATQYDTDFSNTLIGTAQRKLVWSILDKYYPTFDGLDVLEINCGTGVDAVHLAQKGACIFATDIAVEMVKITSSKLREFSFAEAAQLDIKQLETIANRFDLIFSNFGGLNCLNELELSYFMTKTNSIIKEGGRMILVIMPKNTIWERLYFTAKLSPKKALRRTKENGVAANVDGKNVQTYYYNPCYFKQFNEWEVESVSPIGIYVPPSYLENRFKNKPQRIEAFYQKDLTKFNKQRLAKFADHYCIVLKKK